MLKSKLVTGYVKWDGKKYIIEPDLDNTDDKSSVNIDNDKSKILYFSAGKCKIIQK